MIVEISTHGSALRRDHETFIVACGKEKTELPAERVEAIIVTANASLSTQAVRLCIEKNIELVVADWAGRPLGRLWVSTPGKNAMIRRRQYVNQDTRFAFEMSVKLASAKLKGQKRLLIDLRHNRKASNYELDAAISKISTEISELARSSYSKGWKEALMGIEGASAAAYFRAISSCLPSKWSFRERSQYPAKDGFNAVLNYIYGMGYVSVEKAIIMSGLDPNAGFCHADSYGKPTLAFDLIEPVRPLIDRTAVSLFTKKVVHDHWFEKDTEEAGERGGVFLSREARSAVIAAYIERNKKPVEQEAWELCRGIVNTLMETRDHL